MENKTMPNEAKNGLAKNNEAGTTGERKTTFTTETCNGRRVHFGAVLVFCFFFAVLKG